MSVSAPERRFGMVGRLIAVALVAAASAESASAVSPAPALRFADAAGKPQDLSRYRGRPVLVELWASWCVPCIPRLAELDELARRVPADRLAIVPISVDRGGPVAAHRGYVRAKVRSLPLYVADPQDVVAATGRMALPMVLLLDADGNEILRVEGAKAGDDRLERALARIVNTPRNGANR